MKIFQDRFLILLLILGLLIRLTLSPIPGFTFDVDTWFAWAQRLYNVGFAQFYTDKVWTGYPPGFLYILSVLGYIKNLFQIDNYQFYSILKFPSIIAEIITGIFVYYIIPEKNKLWRLLALTLIIFNPAFIFNSAIFGQFDGLFSLIILLSVYFLTTKKIATSSVFWGISFLLKPQAIFLIPVFAFFLIKNFSPKNIFRLSIPALIIILIGFIPFFTNNPINGPIGLVNNLFGYYPYNSIFSYNLWGILGFWVPDNKTFFNINYQNLGFISYGVFLLFYGFLYLKNKISILTLSTITILGFFFLLTRMHERYLYTGLLLLVVTASIKKSLSLIFLSILLTLIYLLDLYYVYIYYNHFFLKTPSALFNPLIYNFADNNIKLISLFATIIFFIISVIVLKLNNEASKE